MVRFQSVTSRQNQQIVNICKLSDKKLRNEEKLFRADGFKLLEEAVKRHVHIRTLVVAEDEKVLERVNAIMQTYDGDVNGILVPRDLFLRISDEKAPEGVITVGEYIDKAHFFAIIKEEEKLLDCIRAVPADRPVLFLETIQNPENLGALVRSASAFGCGLIILSADCADIYHPKALRASMGTIFDMPTLPVSDLPLAVRLARTCGRRVFAAALGEEARLLGDFEIIPGDSVIIGNEGHGLSDGVMQSANECVLIPMEEGTESLNAAVAGGVLLWAFRHKG